MESTLQDIKKMEQEYLADQAAIQKEMKQIQADIDAIYAANAGNGSQVDYSTTGFIYPVKGYTYISSYYGWNRFSGTCQYAHSRLSLRHRHSCAYRCGLRQGMGLRQLSYR